MKKLILLILVLKVMFFCLAADDFFNSSGKQRDKVEKNDITGLKEKIDTYILHYVQTNDFSGTVLIGRRDHILYSRGFGYADLAHNVKNTINTKFRLASITKQFTSAAILILEQEGKLRVSDPVSNFIPEFPAGQKIKLHHFLTHTSGVIDIFSLPNYYEKKNLEMTLEDVVNWIKSEPLQFQPGERYSYSNSGYTLLAYVIQVASGQGYGEYIKKKIFIPLGMDDSGNYERNVVIKNFASGYDPLGYEDIQYAQPSNDALLLGSGSLYSTVQDLFRWDRALRTEKILNKTSKKKMFTDYGNSYGYGVSVYKRDGKKVISHDGRMPGFIGNMARYVVDNTAIIFLGNIQSGVGDFLRDDLAAILFDHEPIHRAKHPGIIPRKPNQDELKRIIGIYEFAPGFHVSIKVDGGKILAQANHGDYSEIVPLSDGLFFSRVLYANIKFEGVDGIIKNLKWISNEGREFTGKKIK